MNVLTRCTSNLQPPAAARRSVWLALALCVGTALTSLAVPEPDNIFYGTVSKGATQLTAASGAVVRLIRVADGIELDAYTMGSNAAAGDRYVLRAPYDQQSPAGEAKPANAVRSGDSVTFEVDGTPVNTTADITQRGEIRQLHLTAEVTCEFAPVSPQEIDEGETKTFSATPAVTVTSYVWRIDGVQVGTDAASFIYTPGTDTVVPPDQSVQQQLTVEVKDGAEVVCSNTWQLTVWDMPVVEAPVFSPADGTTIPPEGLDVTISCPTSGCTIYYATDGTDPDETSTEYVGPLHLTETVTIRARAYKDGLAPSGIVEASYTKSAGVSCPWGDPVSYPNPQMTVVCQLVRGDGTAITDTDRVGAFVGGELRAKQPVFFDSGSAYATLTVQVKENGETVSFRLWDSLNGEAVDGAETVAAVAGATVGSPTDPLVVNFGAVDQTVSLAMGWNQISFAVDPADRNPDAVFALLGAKVEKVLSDNATYVPGWGAFNSLTEMKPCLGHYVKMSEAADLTVSGLPIGSGLRTVDLEAGWNNIGFPYMTPSTVEGTLADLGTNLEKVVGAGGSYIPGWGDFNTLTVMEPGAGYWVKVTSAATLTYAHVAPSLRSRGGTPAARVTRGTPDWTVVNKTNPGFTYVAEVTLDGVPVTTSDLVGAFVGDECRAKVSPFTVSGVSYVTLTIQVDADGEGATFRLYDVSDDTVLDADVTVTLTPGGGLGDPNFPESLAFSMASAALWPVTLDVVGATPLTLAFGMADGATEDFDDTLDEDVTIPPPGEAGCFFYRLDPAEMSFRKDIIGTAETGEWLLVVQADADTPVELSWDVANLLPANQYLTMYEVDESHVPLGGTARNMGTTATRTVLAGDMAFFVLRYATDLVADIALHEKWNLVSFPIQPHTTDVAAVFDEANAVTPGVRGSDLRDGMRGVIYTGSVWAYHDRAYHEVADVVPLTGYWVYADAPTALLVTGLPVPDDDLHLVPGWNLVGPVAPIAVPANEALRGRAWLWNAVLEVYETTDDLAPCRGHWLNAREAVTLETGEERR